MSTDAKLILLKSTFLNEQLSIFISLIVKLVGVSFSSSASKNSCVAKQLLISFLVIFVILGFTIFINYLLFKLDIFKTQFTIDIICSW